MKGQPLSVLPVAFALGALLPNMFRSKNASAAAIHAPPGFVFQIGLVCDSRRLFGEAFMPEGAAVASASGSARRPPAWCACRRRAAPGGDSPCP